MTDMENESLYMLAFGLLLTVTAVILTSFTERRKMKLYSTRSVAAEGKKNKK